MCPNNGEVVFDSRPPGDSRSIELLFIDVLLAGILMLDCWHLSVCLSFLLIALRPPWTAVCMTDRCNVYYASHTVFNMPFCTNTRVHHCTC